MFDLIWTPNQENIQDSGTCKLQTGRNNNNNNNRIIIGNSDNVGELHFLQGISI